MISLKYFYCNSIHADPYNLKGKRNVYNTSHEEFNCGGYALGTMSWYRPVHKGEYLCYDFKTPEENKRIMDICIANMLEEFSDLRVINSLDELKVDEYAIAFRISKNDDDFHFIRREKTGIWTYKQGAMRGIRTMTDKEVFSDNWGDTYFGIITLFAKKVCQIA